MRGLSTTGGQMEPGFLYSRGYPPISEKLYDFSAFPPSSFVIAPLGRRFFPTTKGPSKHYQPRFRRLMDTKYTQIEH